jgi:hypothetical protein
MDICEEVPPMFDVGEDHLAACHLYDETLEEGGL